MMKEMLFTHHKGQVLQCPEIDKLGIVAVHIEDGVQLIERDAFRDFHNLEEITFPISLVKIGKCAFKNCRKLMKIEIGPLIANVADDAFDGCDALEVSMACRNYDTVETFLRERWRSKNMFCTPPPPARRHVGAAP
jgi:hypothetical protein